LFYYGGVYEPSGFSIRIQARNNGEKGGGMNDFTGGNPIVTVDKELLDRLRPSPYLASLGISLEKRVESLTKLARSACSEGGGGEKRYIPFMALSGPFVREDFLPVIASTGIGADGSRSILLALAREEG
jgi:hypothetical protein